MAEECGLSRTRFADLCKRLTNMTPRQYLQSLRLERARQQLAMPGKHNITDVAFSCGFHSSQYFSSAFRTALRPFAATDPKRRNCACRQTCR